MTNLIFLRQYGRQWLLLLLSLFLVFGFTHIVMAGAEPEPEPTPVGQKGGDQIPPGGSADQTNGMVSVDSTSLQVACADPAKPTNVAINIPCNNGIPVTITNETNQPLLINPTVEGSGPMSCMTNCEPRYLAPGESIDVGLATSNTWWGGIHTQTFSTGVDEIVIGPTLPPPTVAIWASYSTSPTLFPNLPTNTAGTCGAADGGTFNAAPASGQLCSVGTNTWRDRNGNDGTYNWDCAGTSVVSCSATNANVPTTNNPPANNPGLPTPSPTPPTNTPPNTPVITNCPVSVEVNTPYQFNFRASDPDSGDRLRYLWNKENINGTNQTGLNPNNGYVNAGTLRSRTVTWNATGEQQFSVQAEDVAGDTSAWAQCSVQVVNPPVGSGPSGSLIADDCDIPAGASSCDVTIRWSTNNTTAPRRLQTGSGNVIINNAPANNSFGHAYTMSRGTTVFNLSDSGTPALNESNSATADCAPATTWNNTTGVCEASGPIVANNRPSVYAGSPKTIQLPISQVTINDASASDSDGDPLTLSWSQVSGPNTAGMSGANGLTPTFSGLVEGQYRFRLTANDGSLSQSAILRVTVEPPPTADLEVSIIRGPSETVESTIYGTYQLDIEGGITNNGPIVVPANSGIPYKAVLTGAANDTTTVSRDNRSIAVGRTISGLNKSFSGVKFGDYQVCFTVNEDAPTFPEDAADKANNTTDPCPQVSLLPPPPDMDLIINPSSGLIRVGDSANVEYTIQVGYEIRCELKGPGLDESFLVGNVVGQTDYDQSFATGALSGTAIYRLTCTEETTGTTFDPVEDKIEVVPGYEEV